jgi:2-phospho-L-lactate/phosphoenolpyruvate guanylyltransferase
MRVRAIVPQKTLREAKSRLDSVLSPPARVELSLRLLAHVVTVLRAVPQVESLVIMTPDPEVCASAACWGVPAVRDPAPDFNAALALTMAEGGPARGVLVLAADLPFLEAADVVAMVRPASPGVLALAPSKDGGGTNALLIPPGVRFQPAYGSGSRAAHRALARARGLETVEVARPGLAFDLDIPADIAVFWFRTIPA